MVLIETVGVGQDEVEIAGLADITVVVLVPGLGDDVQAIKAGIMEIADIFVINKADLPGADRLEQEIRAMQSLATVTERDRAAPIRRVIATEDQGIDDLLDRDSIASKTRPTKSRAEIWSFTVARDASRTLSRGPKWSIRSAHAERVRTELKIRYPLCRRSAQALVSIEIDHLGIAVRSLEEAPRF